MAQASVPRLLESLDDAADTTDSDEVAWGRGGGSGAFCSTCFPVTGTSSSLDERGARAR
jgi:hypothetical protein